MFQTKKKKKVTKNSPSDMERLLTAMDHIAAGDYTPVGETDFSDPSVAKHLNALIDSTKSSNNTFVMQLNASMREIGDSSCVKEMIEQLNSQVSSITNMREAGHNLGASIIKITDTVGEIRTNAHSAMDTSKDSVHAMTESVSLVDRSCKRFAQINEEIDGLHEKISKINEIIDMVKKIANKSSLLALNASIEAARVGEAGKGFAVVANQMQELSSNTADSTSDVIKYVTELKESLNGLFASIGDTTKDLENGNKMVLNSVDGIHNMEEQLGSISQSIDDIFGEVNTQSALTQSFTSSVEVISDSYNKLSEECLGTGSHLYKISRTVDKVRSNMARQRSNLSTLDWLTVFEVDHLIFTWRQYNNLIGYESLNLEQINNPDGCKFGKWMKAQTDVRITKSAAFIKANQIHRTIHDRSVDCFHAAKEGNRELAISYFEKAYDAYTALLPEMEHLRELMISLGDDTATKY